MLKDADPEFLLAAIRTVHQGNQVIAASRDARAVRATSAAATDAAPRRPPVREPHPARARDLRARGARPQNAEIAASEFLSEATVKTHVSRILAKLGLRDRVQLVVFAYEHDLASVE